MRRAAIPLLFAVMFLPGCGDAAEKTRAGNLLTFRGMSDPSAAVGLGDGLFIAGSDEVNTLCVYDVDRPGLPVEDFDLSPFLKVDSEHPECDIEGAATLGDRIYWITSHGRNKDGKLRSSRHRFFATKVIRERNTIRIQPVGKPCSTLARRLVGIPRLRRLGLAKVADFNDKKDRSLAPKKDGLNIEALCASPDGRKLYIGFRNPRPIKHGTNLHQALVVPLLNAAEVVDSGKQPIFGEPILWNLDGRGVRGMTYSSRKAEYWIIAGPHTSGPGLALYRWSGEEAEPPALIGELATEQTRLNPEAMVLFEDRQRQLLISDDGTLPVKVNNASECVPGEMPGDGTCPNKHLADQRRKFFRAKWLEL